MKEAVFLNMFLDEVKIYVKAGNGGDGSKSFRREKYVPAGGPDGGDGGKGGDVVLITDNNIRTLLDFKYTKKYAAQNGENGQKKNMYGKSGQDLIIKVPVGTLVWDEERNALLKDMNQADMTYIVCKGGKGGRGNTHFKSSTRQAPEFAEAGNEGEEKNLFLELRLLADIGIIGMPSVGKSTLISVITAARPKIADYHFTTLVPNLGVVKVSDDYEFVVADIPGLIEGASEGLGLGHEFLKHIERTRLLLHLLDASELEGRDALEDFEIINRELEKYNPDLAQRTQVCVLNKIDLCYNQEMLDRVDEIEEKIKSQGFEVIRISAATKEGTSKLVKRAGELLKELPETFLNIPEVQEVIEEEKELFTVRKEGNTYFVEGSWIKKLVNSTNIYDSESLRYFQSLIREKGVIDELESLGIQEDDPVVMDEFEFDYVR